MESKKERDHQENEAPQQRLPPTHLPIRRTPATAALVMVLVHSILWFGFFFFLVFVVPLQEKTLADFKVKLPEDAVTVIGLSQAAHQSIYFVPLLLLLFLVLDGYVLYLLREKVNSMLYSWLWFLLAALVPLLATYYCWRALSAPLLDGLAQ